MNKVCLISLIVLAYSLEAFNVGTHGSVSVQRGSIQTRTSQAIVNAANPSLARGTGICGAIYQAAEGNPAVQGARGPLTAACLAFPADAQGERCPAGEAKITPSFNIQGGVTHIIHAVGPQCGTVVFDTAQRKRLLAAAYKNSLKRADENNLTSVSFPFISSGRFAPDPTVEPNFLEFAARTAIEAVIEYMEQTNTGIRRIEFALVNQRDFDLFNQLLQQYSTDGITVKLNSGKGKPQWQRLAVGALIGTSIFAGLLWLVTRQKNSPTRSPNP